ncbi:hypothetical protein ACP4OV_010266 [Aristida adscensionis]
MEGDASSSTPPAMGDDKALRVWPASPVFGRVIERIRALDKWAADLPVRKLLDLAACLAAPRDELASIEQAASMAAADLAPRLLQVMDAADRLHDLLDELQYGSLRSQVANDPEEVRPRPLLIPSLFLGRSKHSKSLGGGGGGGGSKADHSCLLHNLHGAVADSVRLVKQLLGEGTRAKNPPAPRALPLGPRRRVAATLTLQHPVLGRDEEQDKIVRSLIQSSPCHRLSVIPVVGSCGVGKTTLAQLVYHDTRVEQHFDLRIWVSISGALSKADITREILHCADPCCAGKIARADYQMLQAELSRLVASHRLLLVLDDLLDGNKIEPVTAWTDIFAPLRSAQIGSSVLVTTPARKIAEMLGTSQPHVISELEKRKCLDLSIECAISGTNLKGSAELEHIAMGFADRIQGLPLATKVLGRLLGAASSPDEWKSILDTQFCGDAALYSVRLSYDFLPAQIKECFAYCALFPKDWKFDRTKLIYLWMAEGFLGRQEDSENNRMEDVGSEYFDALVSLSFFQTHKQGSKTYYMMHHWFHDLAEAISKNVCFRIEPGSTDNIPPTVRHLSVTTDTPVDLNTCCSLKQLRTLLVLRSPSSSLQHGCLTKLKGLYVLDLCDCNITELPKEIGELTHLRYLSLCGTIRRLPESLSRLLHLQILCFPEDCCLDKLPAGTGDLINLRYLDIDTKYTKKLPSIKRLVNLQGSVELHVEKGEGRILQDLSGIKGLRGQLKISGLDNVSNKDEARKAKLNNKQYLKILKLEWTSASRFDCHTTDAKVLENLQPHQNLKELIIRRYSGYRAPSWLRSQLLKELQSLHLINCRNLSTLPPLGQLPSLEKLHMKELCAVTQIGPEFYSSKVREKFYSSNEVAFPSLKVLELVDFPRLLEWSTESNYELFPCLKTLKLIDCPELKQIPLLPVTTTEVTIERSYSVRHLRLAPVSSSSVTLTLDACMTTVLCKRLFRQQHLQSIIVLNINGGKLFATVEGLGSLLSLQKLQLCQTDMTDHDFSLFLEALPSLSSLELIDLPNVTALPLQGCPKLTAESFPTNFGCLVSLRMLSISHCSQFQSLPVGGLPSSLQSLNLIGCHPRLKEQSRNRKQNSWQKVTTVPHVPIQ